MAKKLKCPFCKEERGHVIRDRWQTNVEGDELDVVEVMFECGHKVAMQHSTYEKLTEEE